ncbi:hypothetical protein PFISCL1PPCAC_22065, partial [Pristionchus fissidentatus]
KDEKVEKKEEEKEEKEKKEDAKKKESTDLNASLFDKTKPEPARFDKWSDSSFACDYVPYFHQYSFANRKLCLRACTTFNHHSTNPQFICKE